MERTIYKPNQKYMTSKGAPVLFIGPAKTGAGFIVKSIATGNQISVPQNYQLLDYDAKKIGPGYQVLMTSAGKSGKPTGESKPKLAHKIDAFLWAGKHTVAEIAELIKGEPEAAGKNASANVYARLVSYKRKGVRITKTEKGIVSVPRPKAEVN